jgi:DNA polymerase III subunit beta
LGAHLLPAQTSLSLVDLLVEISEKSLEIDPYSLIPTNTNDLYVLQNVEGLKTKLILPGVAPTEEPPVPIPGSLTSSGWLLRGFDLARALERTRFATDPDSTRYTLGGVALEVAESGEWLSLIATDGRRLARETIPAQRHGTPTWPEDGKPPLLTATAIAVAQKLAAAEGDRPVALAIVLDGPARVQIVTRDAVLTSQVPAGRFPRYRDVYPSGEPTAELRLPDARQLAPLWASVVAATDAESRGVELVLADGNLMTTAQSDSKGQAQLALVGAETQGRATVTLDGTLLLPFLEAADADPLVLKFFAKDQPLWLEAGPHYELIIMPLSRDEPQPEQAATPEPEPEPEPETTVPHPFTSADPATTSEARPQRGRRRRRRNGSENPT